jgi:hypothetical protein
LCRRFQSFGELRLAADEGRTMFKTVVNHNDLLIRGFDVRWWNARAFVSGKGHFDLEPVESASQP